MALTQSAEDKLGFNSAALKDTNGKFYVQLFGVFLFAGSGAPTHTAPLGSLCIDRVNAILYIKTSTAADTTWTKVASNT